MATAEAEAPPALPDYVLDPDAVLKDNDAAWRYQAPPDYSKTRAFYEDTKTKSHTAGSLENLVENLVKNWEIEASFKTSLADWRTINHNKYTFAVNGGAPQPAEHMLNVGTYNAILAANQYYDPAENDFATSHKAFKRMMPTFAWEVLEVYSGPPTVTFRWRHWGVMANDYVGRNSEGKKVTIKANGKPIDIEGVTVAKVNDKLQVEALDTWFDPLAMFRQMTQDGGISVEEVAAAAGSESSGGCPFLGGAAQNRPEDPAS